MELLHFNAKLKIIGVNPFVSVPQKYLKQIFLLAGKDRGPIRVKGTVNEKPFRQTLVRFQGEWRLYINLLMLKNSPKRIGEKINVSISFDPEPRKIPEVPEFTIALKKNKKAKAAFEKLIPSRQLEIVRYIAGLKTEDARKRNVEKAIKLLEN